MTRSDKLTLAFLASVAALSVVFPPEPPPDAQLAFLPALLALLAAAGSAVATGAGAVGSGIMGALGTAGGALASGAGAIGQGLGAGSSILAKLGGTAATVAKGAVGIGEPGLGVLGKLGGLAKGAVGMTGAGNAPGMAGTPVGSLSNPALGEVAGLGGESLTGGVAQDLFPRAAEQAAGPGLGERVAGFAKQTVFGPGGNQLTGQQMGAQTLRGLAAGYVKSKTGQGPGFLTATAQGVQPMAYQNELEAAVGDPNAIRAVQARYGEPQLGRTEAEREAANARRYEQYVGAEKDLASYRAGLQPVPLSPFERAKQTQEGKVAGGYRQSGGGGGAAASRRAEDRQALGDYYWNLPEEERADLQISQPALYKDIVKAGVLSRPTQPPVTPAARPQPSSAADKAFGQYETGGAPTTRKLSLPPAAMRPGLGFGPSGPPPVTLPPGGYMPTMPQAPGEERIRGAAPPPMSREQFGAALQRARTLEEQQQLIQMGKSLGYF